MESLGATTCISASCASISASWARALRTRIFAAATFFSCAFASAVCTLCVTRRNDFALEQILLTPRIVAQEFQLRLLRISVVNRGINLCGGKIAARSQFGSVQLNDRLAGAQSVPFPCENLFHAPAAARSHVHLVHFNGSRNRRFFVAATCEQEKERQSSPLRSIKCRLSLTNDAFTLSAPLLSARLRE